MTIQTLTQLLFQTAHLLQLWAQPITDAVQFTSEVFSTAARSRPVFAATGLPPTQVNVEGKIHRLDPRKPRSRSHDQPHPEAFCCAVNSPLHILCPPIFTPPACPQMQEQYRSVRLAQGVGGPRRASPVLASQQCSDRRGAAGEYNH